MLEIIKYQLKGRKNTLALICGIFALVNLIALAVQVKSLLAGSNSYSSAAAFWVPLSIISMGITTVVLFFKCSTGHVDQLLYKDTNYLMLTVPRHGWEVLGGRFLAGLIEFLIYGITCSVLLSFQAGAMVALSSEGQMNFFQAVGFMYQQVFGLNFFSLLQITVYLLCIFTTVGVFLTFATVASRSFVKNKGIATVITIAVFIFVTNKAIALGSTLSAKLGWYSKIPIMFNNSHMQLQYGNLPTVQEFTIPVAPFIFFILLAAILFAGASWLMEKKVEL